VFVDQAADDDETEKTLARVAFVEGLKDNLIEAVAAEPPAGSFRPINGTGNQFLGGGFGEGGSGGVKGDDPGVFVGENEEVAIVGLPGIFTGVADGSGIAVTHIGERGEQIGFATEGSFLLAMNGLDGEGSVLRIEFDLALDLGLCVAANDEKRDAGERGREKNEGEEELGAQAEIGRAVTQKVCGRAAGQEPCAELVVRHRASRVRLGGR